MPKKKSATTPSNLSGRKELTTADARFADHIGAKVIADATDYSIMHEIAGDEWCELSRRLQRTTCAYLTNPEERHRAANERACFLIGIAIGRRLGGTR